MKIKSMLWSLLLKLPSFLKTPILRKTISFPSEIAESLSFKVAETEDELAQAFALLHDAYVGEKLMTPHPSGMRITKYHALPSTTTLIAVENNQVVGTVSLVRQSSFGLPLSSIFNLKQPRNGERFAEVSALAIKKEFLPKRGRILFPLLKFLFHYSVDYFGVSHFVIAVNPKWIDFYTSILCFEHLTKKPVNNYSFVNGAPAVGGILNLRKTAELHLKAYGRKRNKITLYQFFHEMGRKNMEFPLRKKSVISDPILSPDLLNNFFVKASDCLKNMTDNERAILREMYDHPDYLKIIPPSKILKLHRKRASKRFDINLQGRLNTKEHQSSELIIHNISVNGCGGFIQDQKKIDLQKEYAVEVNIEDLTACELVGRFVRLTSEGEFGFVLSKPCVRWTELSQNLDSRLYNFKKALSGTQQESQLLKSKNSF